MFKDKSFRNGVIASLIASLIFLIFLQPLLNFLWSVLQCVTSDLYSSYINGIYLNAALGHRNWLDLLVYTFINMFILLFFVFSMVQINRQVSIDSFNNKVKAAKTIEEKRNLLEKKQDLLEKRISIGLRILKFYRTVSWFLFFILLLAFTSSLFKAFTDLQLNTSFNQRLNVIEVCSDEQTIKSLKAKWALMKNRNDYLEINKIMEQIAEKNGIELPKKLLD